MPEVPPIFKLDSYKKAAASSFVRALIPLPEVHTRIFMRPDLAQMKNSLSAKDGTGQSWKCMPESN